MLNYRSRTTDYQQLLITYQDQNNFHALAEGQYFLPGFVDLHVHAPQWAQSGTALDIPLYDWLNTYTFLSNQNSPI